jgi:hypothetical protein
VAIVNASLVSDSFATGTVAESGDDSEAGGLACGVINYGRIINSFATGSVTVGNKSQYEAAAGGLVGGAGFSDTATIDGSFATGAVIGGKGARVGGLEGDEGFAYTTHSYALGPVSGGAASSVGGLIGHRQRGTLDENYSVGRVTGPSHLGGLIGYNHGNAQKWEYWDTDTSGTVEGCGNENCTLIQPITDAQLKSGLPAGFDPQVWGQSPNINNGYPYLLANPPPKNGKAVKHRTSGAARAR